MRIKNLCKVLIIILCFCSLQVVAMKSKNKVITFGVGAHAKFLKKKHYVSAGEFSRNPVMCLYCALVCTRSDAGRKHIYRGHGVKFDCSKSDQDLEDLNFPSKCAYDGCDFEFEDAMSFLKHVKSHTQEFKQVSCCEESVTKKSINKKRKRSEAFEEKENIEFCEREPEKEFFEKECVGNLVDEAVKGLVKLSKSTYESKLKKRKL